MSLQNPSTLYTQNQGIFDSTPYLKLEQSRIAQQAAKDQALDKYFNDLPSRLNGAGLADEDIPGLNNRVDEIKKMYLQNKDAIRKGGAARYNYDKAIRETSGYIEQGKNKAKSLLEAGKLKFQKENKYIFDDPNVAEVIVQGSLPMDDPNYKAVDLAALVVPPKPFDDEVHNKALASIKPSEIEITTVTDPDDNLKDIVTKIPKFAKNEMDKIQTGALENYYSDRSYKNRVDEVAANPETNAILKGVYQRYFGVEPSTAQQYATAYDLSKLQLPQEKVAKFTNLQRQTAGRNAEWDRRNAIAFNQSMQKISANKSGSGGDDVDVYDIYSGIDNATKDPQATINVGGKRIGTRVNALGTDGQFVVLDFARKLTGNNALGNDDIYIDKTPEGIIEVYKAPSQKANPLTGAIPEWKKDKSMLIGTLPRIGTNIKVQPGAKEKRAVIGQGNNNTNKKSTSKGDFDDL